MASHYFGNCFLCPHLHSSNFYSSISVKECLETVDFYHVYLQESIYRSDDIKAFQIASFEEQVWETQQTPFTLWDTHAHSTVAYSTKVNSVVQRNYIMYDGLQQNNSGLQKLSVKEITCISSSTVVFQLAAPSTQHPLASNLASRSMTAISWAVLLTKSNHVKHGCASSISGRHRICIWGKKAWQECSHPHMQFLDSLEGYEKEQDRHICRVCCDAVIGQWGMVSN